MSDKASAYNRAAHDGTQAISTVDGLQAELDLKLEAADMQAALDDLVADIDGGSPSTTYTDTIDGGTP